MKRRLCALALVALPAVAAPAAGAQERFEYGVAAGDVESTTAVLWAKSTGPARVRLVVARDRRFRRALREYFLTPRRSDDYTLRRRVRGLRPGTRYWYRFGMRGANTQRGTFVTAPSPSRDSLITFAWTGDTDFNARPGETRSYWNQGGVFERMREEKNDFNVHLGDTIYSDSEVPGRLNPVAMTVRQKWQKYKVNLFEYPLRALRGSAGFYSHWDDHEFINDFARGENVFSSGSGNGERIYRRGVSAFYDYAPVRYSRRDGLYRRMRWGQNLEIFFLDERSFRAPKASKDGVCDNPQTGEPDLAPTLPQSYRDAYGAALPQSGLSQPVSRRCLDTIRSRNRPYLGRRQLTRFRRDIARSTARFKVIMNELPIQQYYALPYDRWEGYEAERQHVLRFLSQRIKNVIFLTTDVHATLVNDARLSTLEEGGPVNTGIWDFTVGPAATANFGLEIDEALGSEGGGELIDNAAFEPDPPTGIGMRCSNIDTFSYGHVRVSNTRLIVAPRDINGRPLRECPPLEIRYRP